MDNTYNATNDGASDFADEGLLEFHEYPDAMFGGAEVMMLEDEDDGTVLRVLYVGGGFQSATFVDDHRFELVFEYFRGFDVLFEVCPQAKDVLMLGAGGCCYPKHLLAHYPQTSVDAVEIDPVVLDIARKHFYMDEAMERFNGDERCRMIAADGRTFLEEEARSYDAILNDCFSGQELVTSLASTEAAKLIQTHLNAGGVYLANVVSKDDGTDLSNIQNVATTLARVFKHVHVIPCFDEDYAGEDNYLVAACDADLHFPTTLNSPEVFAGSVITD